MTRSARLAAFSFPVSADVAFPFVPSDSVQALENWVAWSQNCDFDGIQTTRENIAMALLTVQA